METMITVRGLGEQAQLLEHVVEDLKQLRRRCADPCVRIEASFEATGALRTQRRCVLQVHARHLDAMAVSTARGYEEALRSAVRQLELQLSRRRAA